MRLFPVSCPHPNHPAEGGLRDQNALHTCKVCAESWRELGVGHRDQSWWRDPSLSDQGSLVWVPQQVGTVKGADLGPPPNSLCIQLGPPTGSASSTQTSHCSCPESSPCTLGSTLEGQITSPNQVNLPPFYFRSAQPGVCLGAADADFSPGLTQWVGPCDSPSRPFDGESLPNK